MTEFEDTYRHLVLLDPPLRRQWLLDHRPASVSPLHWWLGLIEAAVSDLRSQQRAWPATRPRADTALAACLIEWVLEQGFPVRAAVGQLTQLITIARDAGQPVNQLSGNARPDAVVRTALNGLRMTRSQAIARAASLRAVALTEQDLVQPGEDWLPAWRALTSTDDYRDYHHLIDIDQVLTDLTPHLALLSDTELAAELRGWLDIQPDLNPYAAMITADPDQPD